jgi:hypothetical protein
MSKSTELAPLNPTVETMFAPTSTADIVIPQIRVVAELSSAAKGGKNAVAAAGDVILANGADDPNPIHLISDEAGDSFEAYIIGRRPFAATTSGGGFEFQAERDPDDPDSWNGWIFDVALPEIDEVLPATWMLWKTAGAMAARNINTMIDRALAAGDFDPICIRVTIQKKTSRSGFTYFAPAVRPGEKTPGGVTIAKQLQEKLSELKRSQYNENAAPQRERLEQPAIS